MKHLIILFLSFLLISCGESFEEIDTEMINKDIAQYKNIKSPEELITIYYNYPSSEGKPNLKIEKKELEKNVFEITLIHDYQQDDSQKAEKIIMVAEKIGEKWHVKRIRRNWKCYDGRGHTDWGTSNCG